MIKSQRNKILKKMPNFEFMRDPTTLRTTGRRLCEGFCLLQNRQMYEVPQGEYIALESRRPDVRKPTLWAVIGRDFVHRAACWRRSGLERRNFQLCTNVAKPFFLFAKLQKRAKEKWFLRINM